MHLCKADGKDRKFVYLSYIGFSMCSVLISVVHSERATQIPQYGILTAPGWLFGISGPAFIIKRS